jgi:hypothetical protein
MTVHRCCATTQVLGGRPTPVDKMLRYKKKMVLWGKDHVGYCCMTFVIRNGLTALGNGDGTYLKYVDSLISNWQLTARDKEQVRGPLLLLHAAT